MSDGRVTHALARLVQTNDSCVKTENMCTDDVKKRDAFLPCVLQRQEYCRLYARCIILWALMNV